MVAVYGTSCRHHHLVVLEEEQSARAAARRDRVISWFIRKGSAAECAQSARPRQHAGRAAHWTISTYKHISNVQVDLFVSLSISLPI